MNEILDCRVQSGKRNHPNRNCDIVFDHVGFSYQSGETVLRDVSFTAKQERSRRWSDPPAEVRLPFPAWRRGSGTLTGAGSPWAAWISPESIRKS